MTVQVPDGALPLLEVSADPILLSDDTPTSSRSSSSQSSRFSFICPPELQPPTPSREPSENSPASFSRPQQEQVSRARNCCSKLISVALVISTFTLALMNLAFYEKDFTSHLNKNTEGFWNQTLSLGERYKFNSIDKTTFQNSFEHSLEAFLTRDVGLWSQFMLINVYTSLSLYLGVMPRPSRHQLFYSTIKITTGITMAVTGYMNIPKDIILASPLCGTTGTLLVLDELSIIPFKSLCRKLKHSCCRISTCCRRHIHR